MQEVLLCPTQALNSQRQNLCKTRCTIKKKVYNAIIDYGSNENIIFKALEQATMKHPHLYGIGWIKKANELMVVKVYKVSFSTRNFYQNALTCNVVDIQAFYMLLGWPWFLYATW